MFYATAFGLKLNDELWTALTFVLGLTLRLLAIRYKWEMPKFVVQRAIASADDRAVISSGACARLRDLLRRHRGAALPQALRI